MMIDWTKLATLILVVAGAIFLTWNGNLESEACVALLGAALGYVFGNGHGVAEARSALAQVREIATTLSAQNPGPGPEV